jgi:hypothetical protein
MSASQDVRVRRCFLELRASVRQRMQASALMDAPAGRDLLRRIRMNDCGSKPGPCQNELEAAYEASSADVIESRYVDRKWAGGVAIDRADCFKYQCRNVCE